MKKPTILIADDEPGFRFPLVAILTDAGYTVIEAADGVELARGAPDAEVLVVDVRLQTGSAHEGIRVIRSLRESSPQERWQPTVFISVLSQDACRHELESFPGPYAWLRKPFDGAMLIWTIQHAATRLGKES